MNNQNVQQTIGGIGVFRLLGVLFIGLKLTGHISWSWLWVLAPFWGPFLVFLIFAVIVLILWS